MGTLTLRREHVSVSVSGEDVLAFQLTRVFPWPDGKSAFRPPQGSYQRGAMMRALQTTLRAALFAGLCCVTAGALGRAAFAQPQGAAPLTGPAAIQVFQPSLISNPNEPFGPDDQIKFGLRSDFSTWLAVATAHAFRASHRASHDVREPDVWEPEAWKEVEGCLIYDAVSIPAQQCNNGHELCLGRAGSMYGEWEEGATYLLVFDKGSVPLSGSQLHKLYEHEEHHQFIGIKKGDTGSIFRTCGADFDRVSKSGAARTGSIFTIREGAPPKPGWENCRKN